MYFLFFLSVSIFLYYLTSRKIRVPTYLVAIFLALYIGLRQQVGGDWDEYLRLYRIVKDDPNPTIGTWRFEPGYWLTYRISPSFELWNLTMAGISIGALYLTAKSMKLKTFRLLLPLGFLLVFIISYTGFVRQGAASSLLALAFGSFIWSRKVFIPIISIILALSFHNPMKLFINKADLRQYISTLTTDSTLITHVEDIGVPKTTPPVHFSNEQTSLKLSTPTEKQPSRIRYQSVGVTFRALFLISLLISLLILRRSARKLDLELKILLCLCAGIFIMLVTNQLISGASTAIDRSLYYIIPFFFLVLSKKMDNHNPSFKFDWAEVFLITISCFFSLGWLLLSPHSLSYR